VLGPQKHGRAKRAAIIELDEWAINFFNLFI
jgi:hypothetical protein